MAVEATFLYPHPAEGRLRDSSWGVPFSQPVSMGGEGDPLKGGKDKKENDFLGGQSQSVLGANPLTIRRDYIPATPEELLEIAGCENIAPE